MSSTLLIAVEWLWKQKGHDLWVTPAVLTQLNEKDPSAPKLSASDAINVFHFLSREQLIFPIRNNNHTVYLLNEIKEQEWLNIISELKMPKWKRSKTLKTIRKILLWFVMLIIAALLGAILNEFGKDFYHIHVKSSILPPNKLQNNHTKGQNSDILNKPS